MLKREKAVETKDRFAVLRGGREHASAGVTAGVK